MEEGGAVGFGLSSECPDWDQNAFAGQMVF